MIVKEVNGYIYLYNDDVMIFGIRNTDMSHVTIICDNEISVDDGTVDVYENGICTARGKSRVFLSSDDAMGYYYDNSTGVCYNGHNVTCYDNADVTIECCDKILAYGNSKLDIRSRNRVIELCDKAVAWVHKGTVHACGEATVYAKNDTNVYAYDNTKVHLSNRATVHARDFSKIYASGFGSVYKETDSVTIIKSNFFGKIVTQSNKLKKDMIVFKKLRGNCIATLRLQKGQVFQSAKYGKCRTDRAFVISIKNDKGIFVDEGTSMYDCTFKYKVGEEVSDYYDTDIDECSSGIHFFLTEEEAKRYEL